MINVRVVADKVIAKYNGIRTRLPQSIEEATQKSVLYVHQNIPPYPSPPSGSTYQRTGRLGRSITTMMGSAPDAISRVEVKAFGSIGYIGSGVDYSPYVIDEKVQAYMHRGRWWTLQSVLRSSTAGIVKIYRDTIVRLFR